VGIHDMVMGKLSIQALQKHQNVSYLLIFGLDSEPQFLF
jgi:hypothetical protein